MYLDLWLKCGEISSVSEQAVAVASRNK